MLTHYIHVCDTVRLGQKLYNEESCRKDEQGCWPGRLKEKSLQQERVELGCNYGG